MPHTQVSQPKRQTLPTRRGDSNEGASAWRTGAGKGKPARCLMLDAWHRQRSNTRNTVPAPVMPCRHRLTGDDAIELGR